MYKKLNSTGTLIKEKPLRHFNGRECIASGQMFTRRRTAAASRMRVDSPNKKARLEQRDANWTAG